MVNAAATKGDAEFQEHLPNLLIMLAEHSLAINEGLSSLLDRYCRCTSIGLSEDLRDFAVGQWGNPWLSVNQAKWSLVSNEARAMVVDWLKLDLLRQFFSLLTEDGRNDTRRLKFWERYHDSIDDMYFALGNTARWHRGTDFQAFRKKAELRLLGLHNAGSPTNNAFIMCIGNYVVVEFGLKGNACHIFRRDALPFALSGEIAGNGMALKHESFVERLRHFDKTYEKWETTFQRAISKLIQVRPNQPEIASSTRRPVSPSPTSGLSEREAFPYVPAPPLTAGPARSQESPPTPGTASPTRFSFSEFSRLCDTRRIRFQDLRDRNGNLWAFTGDADGYVSGQLRSWGFTYKSGKGWWRK